jgi:CHRD domain
MPRVRPLVSWLAVLLLVLAPASVVTAAPAAQGAPRVLAATATLSGAEEVPPVPDTAGSGEAVSRLSPDGMTLRYTLVAVNLTSPPTGAHIHAPAPRGQNADVVAFLYPAPNARSRCDQATALALRCEGELTAADLRGPLAGQPLSALVALLAAGQTYTNVHTERHPGGEVRGQNEPVLSPV